MGITRHHLGLCRIRTESSGTCRAKFTRLKPLHPVATPPRRHPGHGRRKGARDMQVFGNSRVKWPYVTHLVDPARAKSLVPMVDGHDPGSLVLARVLSLSRHRDLESHEGRRVALFPGDVFVGVLGDRYATDQYLAFGRVNGPVGHI